MAPTRRRRGSRRRPKSNGGKHRDGATDEMRRIDAESEARFVAIDTSEEARGFLGDAMPPTAFVFLALFGEGRNPDPESLDLRESVAFEALAAHADLLRAWLDGSRRAWDHALARWGKAIAQVARPSEATRLSNADSVRLGLLERGDSPKFLRGIRDGARYDVELSLDGAFLVPGRPADLATREAANRLRPLLTSIHDYSSAQRQRDAVAADAALAGISADGARLIRDAGEVVDQCTATADLARPSAMLVLVIQQDVEQRTGRRPSVETVRRALWRRG